MPGGEDVAEVVAVGVDEKDFQCCHDQGHSDCLRRKRNVEQKDDDDDGAEDRERDADIAAYQQEHACDDVEHSQESEPSVREHDRRQGSGVSDGWRLGDEVEEEVEAEDGEDEAEQDAGDEGSDLHEENLLCCASYAWDLHQRYMFG